MIEKIKKLQPQILFSMKTPFTFIIVDDVKPKTQIDYSEFIEKVKTMIEDEGLRVTVKQVIVEE